VKVSLEPAALETLYDISDFIDSIHTAGAGGFWATDFIFHIYTYAKPDVTYALCNNKILAGHGLSCLTYKGWVVAFKIEDDELIVYLIIKGSMLI
jgi:hypothetical protein